MMSEPQLQQRGAQAYAAIRTRVTMAQIPTACPPLIGEVFRWLASHSVEPSGPPFFRYAAFDAGHMTIDVGFPLASGPQVDDPRVRAGVFPAGRYATMVHTGHYSGLHEATQRLLAWGQEKGVAWQASPDEREWAARIESYPTDPMEEPDPQQWVTELAILVKDNGSP